MKKFANLHASRFANLKSLQVLHAAAALEFEFVCKLRIRIFLDRKICNVCNCANLQELFQQCALVLCKKICNARK